MESHLRLLSAFHCLLVAHVVLLNVAEVASDALGPFVVLTHFFLKFIYFKVKPYVVSHIKRIIPSVILRVKITAH